MGFTLSRLQGSWGKTAEYGSYKQAQIAERKNMSSDERLLSLREQLKNVCQLGAHGSESFTRSQAKAVLGMTMALLAEPTVGFVSSQEMNNE